MNPELAEAARQSSYDIRFEWGLQGLDAVAAGCRSVVVVDVLRFTTAVTVAVGRGAAVLPFAWRQADAAAYAERHDAELASSERQPGMWSLSPTDLQQAHHRLRLVLPSPNGSALAAWAVVAVDEGEVAAGCIRNASAAGRWLAKRCPAAVIAAGERWADDSLRPAVEDLIGAGAVLAAAHEATRGERVLSPEAHAAVAAFASVRDGLGAALSASVSGRELGARGYADDVAMAAALDAETVVPVLDGPAFVAR